MPNESIESLKDYLWNVFFIVLGVVGIVYISINIPHDKTVQETNNDFFPKTINVTKPLSLMEAITPQDIIGLILCFNASCG